MLTAIKGLTDAELLQLRGIPTIDAWELAQRIVKATKDPGHPNSVSKWEHGMESGLAGKRFYLKEIRRAADEGWYSRAELLRWLKGWGQGWAARLEKEWSRHQKRFSSEPDCYWTDDPHSQFRILVGTQGIGSYAWYWQDGVGKTRWVDHQGRYHRMPGMSALPHALIFRRWLLDKRMLNVVPERSVKDVL